jgi:hypothetical protein
VKIRGVSERKVPKMKGHIEIQSGRESGELTAEPTRDYHKRKWNEILPEIIEYVN